MNNEQKNKHKKTKIILKIVGFTLLAVGVILSVIGFANFGNFESNLFSCTFFGLPCVAIGAFITFFAFSQSIARYVKNEQAPIMNEFSEDIRPAVKNYAEAIGEGLNRQNEIICSCGERNEKGDKFCSACGKALQITCPTCGKLLEIDDNYCTGCGEKLK